MKLVKLDFCYNKNLVCNNAVDDFTSKIILVISVIRAVLLVMDPLNYNVKAVLVIN